VVLASCTQISELPSTPVEIIPEEPADEITFLPPVSGIIAVNAYDGRINLYWDRSDARDFDHYNIYVSETEIAGVDSINPVYQIEDISRINYQIDGLEDGTEYYFAVTAVDKAGNEDRNIAAVKAKPEPMQEGKSDPDIEVEIYMPEKAWPGTTLLPDNHEPSAPRIIEVNMQGDIIWEYRIPQELKRFTNPGFDAELLPDGNILFLLPGKGIYEIDRDGRIVWTYLTSKISHDADRLSNGNNIYVYGGNDGKADSQVVEVNSDGEIVWSWQAADHFNESPYADIYNEGWTHTNAVTRLDNGNTLISPRNFDFMVEVDADGLVVRTIGEGMLLDQHDPEVLPGGNILLADHTIPHRAREIDPETGEIVWESSGFEKDETPVRDADRLPNGNTLITGSTKIIEVTPEGETVWQLLLKNTVFNSPRDKPALGFYKAQRIGSKD
jgi:hypothetical protein